MPEPQRSRNMDRAERKFDVMQALGTDLILVCANVQPSAIDDDSRAVADLTEMAERAARRGLRVCFEALAWSRHVNRWGRAWKIVQQANYPALGLIVDSFHTLSLNDDFWRRVRQLPAEKAIFCPPFGCTQVRYGRAFLEPSLPSFPGQGALDVYGLHARRSRIRLSWAAQS